MSFTGPGPFYVAGISICTAILLFLINTNVLSVKVMWIPDLIWWSFGVFLIFVGIYLWYQGALKSNLHENIRNNKLVTDGVYSHVRNPIYSGFMLAEWGILFLSRDCYSLLAVPLYWLFMTILMKKTEEKWLFDAYGEEYEKYCRKVNRCIPSICSKI